MLFSKSDAKVRTIPDLTKGKSLLKSFFLYFYFLLIKQTY